MKSIIKFVSFSNIWIGLAACVLAMSNLLSLRWLPNMAEPALSIHGAKYLLIFIGTSCTSMYTAIRLVGLREKHETASSEMLDWVRKYKTFVIIWAAICLLIAMYCFYQLYMVQMLIIMFAGLLCGLYAVPIYKSGTQWKSLREVPYLKTIIVAIVWSMLCVSCVMVQANMYPVIVRPQHILLFAINFFLKQTTNKHTTNQKQSSAD